MPLYDDFDTQMLIQPGGVALKSFVQQWSDLVGALDRDDVCGAADVRGFACWRLRQIMPGVRRADDDPRGKILAEFVSEHHNMNVAESTGKSEFRDDVFVTPEGVFHWSDINPYGLRAQIEASKVPMMVWCGWMDASQCEGALIRYRTFSNPQVLIIGPLSHGGDFNADPFGAKHTPAEPRLREQYKMEADFFDEVLRGREPQVITSSIQYYTMGEGKWHTTRTWQPAGLAPERLYFEEHNALGEEAPAAAKASDSYAVDFTASSGAQVVYQDRASEDKKLLVYTGAPLPADLEITGSPVVTLEMASTASDGAIHAYLEDLAPDSRVTYVDEGIFRVIDRKEVDPKTLPYKPLGPAHSLFREDAAPLVPSEPATIRFSMYPTSVLLHAGHRIRIALAGADASLFQRYPAKGTPTWTVYRQARRASFVELPVKQRQPNSK
jgi:putative CocE/NonD family hydrolase